MKNGLMPVDIWALFHYRTRVKKYQFFFIHLQVEESFEPAKIFEKVLMTIFATDYSKFLK
ncbi:hypothetical protein DTW91_10790 [Chryseobacterium sp. SC28]|nr:hypothetical protein DTW91_10790 [Chryseobacterium sp. SC28]